MSSPGFFSFLLTSLNTFLVPNQTEQQDYSTTTVVSEITNIHYRPREPTEILLLTECIAIRSIINITVEDEEKNTISNIFLNRSFQNKVIVNGTCEPTKQKSIVSWSPGDNFFDCKLTFEFGEESERYDLESIGITCLTKEGTEIIAQTDRGLFTIPVGGYYECANPLERELIMEDNDNIKINIYFLNSSMEAFRLEDRAEFTGHVIDCPLSIPWFNKVPTVVCITLLLIGLTVLSIYLCSRLSKRLT
ncbi:unnamed protein product [Schistosoma turkestanicum]|nr:unnamed protein product [Schistosoma turkestanicum]